MDTVKIEGVTYHVLRIRTPEEYLGTQRPKKLAKYHEQGIAKIYTLQRFYDAPVFLAFKYTNGALKWAI